MKITIYADMLFLINFIINIILLKISSLFVRNPANTLRIFISASVGAIYAVCMFFPDISFFYIFPFKLLISVIMIKIIYKNANIIRLFKNTVVFYMVSFTFAGVLLALIYIGSISNTVSPIIHNGVFYFDISLSSLILASLISYVVIAAAGAVFKRNKNLGIRNLKIVLSDRMCEIAALSDTGNLLTDPISNMPVIIAEDNHLSTLFPDGMPDVESRENTNVRIRLIPYSSLGTTGGILTGFVPDEISIDGRKATGVVVAICHQPLSKSDEYNALFNPIILQGGKL